jgi:hypothetical protein
LGENVNCILRFFCKLKGLYFEITGKIKTFFRNPAGVCRVAQRERAESAAYGIPNLPLHFVESYAILSTETIFSEPFVRTGKESLSKKAKAGRVRAYLTVRANPMNGRKFFLA